ncbi:MAG: diaminopimelate decarboxylase [Planctomycetota bacterium]|nr:diaminopimelate decarboxylase [Planctomycetota bacterium]
MVSNQVDESAPQPRLTSLGPLVDRVGTPTYFYSLDGISAAVRRFQQAFEPINPKLLFAVKACSNIHVLAQLASLGCGMDVVSAGELERAWLAGTPMENVSFAGTGKTVDDIAAALDGRNSPLRGRTIDRHANAPDHRGAVGLFVIESVEEAARIDSLARRFGVRARACVRLNPDVDAQTHHYITTGKTENKFGVDLEAARRLFTQYRVSDSLSLCGLHMHLGSLMASPEPIVSGVRALLAAASSIEAETKTRLEVLNIGGGLGVDYGSPDSAPVAPVEDFARAIIPELRARSQAGTQICLEPGRALVAPSGVLVTTVQYVKRRGQRTFIICDAGMQTLIRPALYGSYHFVWPLSVKPEHTPRALSPDAGLDSGVQASLELCDVVGPVCESSDFLAKRRPLPRVVPGDRLAVFTAGAYGMSMASTYNQHPLPAEVLVRGSEAELIRPRGDIYDLLRTELDDPQRLS